MPARPSLGARPGATIRGKERGPEGFPQDRRTVGSGLGGAGFRITRDEIEFDTEKMRLGDGGRGSMENVDMEVIGSGRGAGPRRFADLNSKIERRIHDGTF